MSSNNDGGDKPKPTYSTRVFKKAAPNNKITAYLGRRDFFDTGEKVDVVDGVVLVDRDYMNRETGWKVFVHLNAAFRYGREDLESSTGLIYKKDVYSKYFQVYPPQEEDKKITRLQDRLIKKLGDSAYPFLFELPRHLAASVSILPAPGENGKPAGVDYQLTAFVGFGSDDKVDKKNSVKMAIKKLNLMQDTHKKQPSIDLKKEFVLSNYPVCIEARLDKELYIHGEEIKLFLNIDNRSSKTLRNLVVEVKQYADVTVGGISANYKAVVAQVDSEVGFPVNPSSHMSQQYSLTPSMDSNTRQEGRRGCALDGQYKVGDSNLAASSVLGDFPTSEMREAQAIVVQYKLKAKLTVVRGTDIKFDLPFRLAHSRPTEPVFVRKSGNDGVNPQYVTVNQTEAANLMSTMSEYTSMKKPTQSAGEQPREAKRSSSQEQQPAGRISAPPGGNTYSQVKRPTATQQPAQPAQQAQAQPKAAAQPSQPAVSNDLIDLMMFDPTKNAQNGAAPSNTAADPLFDMSGGAKPAQPQQQNFGMMQQQQQPQMQQQPFGQQAGMGFMGQPQQPFGQPQQAFGMQQPGMQAPNAVYAQPHAQQQPFMGMQQQQPQMFGGAQPMSTSNPFAMQQQQQQQQVQPFGGMQQQQMPAQNFMGGQPQAQAFGGANMFGGNPTPMHQQQQPQRQAAPAAQNDDDMFLEFVNMRMDASDA